MGVPRSVAVYYRSGRLRALIETCRKNGLPILCLQSLPILNRNLSVLFNEGRQVSPVFWHS